MRYPHEEDHKREQFFYDPPTLRALASALSDVAEPCLLGVPMLAELLHVERGRSVTLLDIDDRFQHLPGFQRWDMFRPRPLERRFDLILCDPPFSRVSLAQLFDALRVLAHGDVSQPLVLSHLARREHDVIGALAPFGLRRLEATPGYVSVQDADTIAFFGNVELL